MFQGLRLKEEKKKKTNAPIMLSNYPPSDLHVIGMANALVSLKSFETTPKVGTFLVYFDKNKNF